MKCVCSLLMVLFLNLSFSQNKELNIKAIDSIVFYDFDGNSKGEGASIIDGNGKLLKDIKKSFKLSKIETTEFFRILNQKSSYGGTKAFCFNPHLGIVFYTKGQPTYFINLCLSCNGLRKNFSIEAQDRGNNGGDVYLYNDGMSKKFRSYINSFLIKHRFSNQITRENMFDK